MKRLLLVALFALYFVVPAGADAWPPKLPGAVEGVVTLSSPLFLKTPPEVQAAVTNDGAAPFVVAKVPPVVELALHGNLGDLPEKGTLWSSWGDIGVASDGRVYSAIGNHGKCLEGTARALLYRWTPDTKRLQQVCDVNAIVPRKQGEPTWGKVHARIDEGPDGAIYFSATLNDGNRANLEEYRWSDAVTGGQLYRLDPATDAATVYAALPPARCTATSIMDRRNNRWWCNLEAGPNALFALDLATGKPFFKAPDGTTGNNRNFALADDGAIYFNGTNGIWRYNPKANAVERTASAFPENRGMRSSTRQSRTGRIYGVTYRPGTIFSYEPATDTLTLLGPEFLGGNYTTVCVLSPDEKYLYYLPGAHGQARSIGTPVVQYDIAAGRRKVIAFLREAFETGHAYVPAGTYGVKMSADGATLYVNFNGHPGAAILPEGMAANGFGLTAFAAIHIPASER